MVRARAAKDCGGRRGAGAIQYARADPARHASEITDDVKDYHINIFHSEEDEGYIADVPDLAYCSAFGETPAEALAELEKAKAAWLDAARESGQPIPIPKYRPAIYQAAP